MANLVWKELTVTVKKNGEVKGPTLLREVSGCIGPTDLLAFMGPSGSGKTTLLDVLAGRKASNLSRKGTIRLNGHESNLSYGVASYVVQSDHLIGTLTVKETLTFVAGLRLPSGTNGTTRAQRVDDIINELGLKTAENVIVGDILRKGISGGQKRRLSIGCELLTSPPLLFLDEPTSGLDAASAYFVMKGIRDLAIKGRTVICVIHQPSSEVFELFDKLCLLSSGQTVYFGEALRAIDVFRDAGLSCPDHRNPADHFLQCINRDFELLETETFRTVDDQIEALMETFEKSILKKEMLSACEGLSVERERYKGPSKRSRYFQRTAILTYRTFLDYLRNIAVFWMRVAMYVVLCICIGTMFFDLDDSWSAVESRGSMVFFVSAFLTFMAIAAFPAYAEELQVYKKEVLNGYYSTSAYVIASTIASLPFLILISVSSSACVYFLSGLRNEFEAFSYFVLNLLLSLMVTEGLMLSIAAVVPHYLIGIAGGAGIMGLYMLVSGFFQGKDDLPDPVWKYPLHYISFQTYSFTGLINNEFGDTGSSKWRCPLVLNAEDDDCRVGDDAVIESFGAANRDKWIEIGILSGMFVAYRLLLYVILKIREFKQKTT